MPADYQTAAERLSVSPSRSPSPPAPWTRHGRSRSSIDSTANPTSAHRLSTARIRSLSSASASAAQTHLRTAWALARSANEYSWGVYNRMTVLQRVLAGLGIILIYVLLILAWVFSHRVFDWLADVSAAWRELPGGWLIIFFVIFVTSFPPVIGYSTVATASGFIYGFPWGWPVVAAACTTGSLCAFIASRTILSKWVDRMVGKDPRFVALGEVLRRDGLWYLTGVRFCPLPFSLSNGFLATIPSISPFSFALCTALSSPKLLVHVFVGSRLAIIAENGDKMSFGDRLVNYLGMFIGGVVGIVVGWVIYQRTMARAAELARESAAAQAEEGLAGSRPYLDSEDTLMDPEDAAALMSDDDISLWETQAVDDDEGSDDDTKNKKTTRNSGADDRW